MSAGLKKLAEARSASSTFFGVGLTLAPELYEERVRRRAVAVDARAQDADRALDGALRGFRLSRGPTPTRCFQQITGPSASPEFKMSLTTADKYRPFAPGCAFVRLPAFSRPHALKRPPARRLLPPSCPTPGPRRRSTSSISLASGGGALSLLRRARHAPLTRRAFSVYSPAINLNAVKHEDVAVTGAAAGALLAHGAPSLASLRDATQNWGLPGGAREVPLLDNENDGYT